MKNILTLFTLGILLCATACQNQPKSVDKTNTETTTAPASKDLVDGTYCYEYRVGKDVTTIKIVVNGNDIIGDMNYLPHEKDSGRGTLKGTRNSNEISAVWTYVIEGSNQTEEVMFKIEGEQLMRKTGELVDEKMDGNLKMKDANSAQYTETYVKVACP